MGRKNYPIDLTDKEWEQIKIYFPDTIRTDKRGRPREHTKKEILNGIFYILRSGCSWRMLPHDLPPWKTIYHYFRLWTKDGTLKKLMMPYEKKFEPKQIEIENPVLV
jgi:putative transposase